MRESFSVKAKVKFSVVLVGFRGCLEKVKIFFHAWLETPNTSSKKTTLFRSSWALKLLVS